MSHMTKLSGFKLKDERPFIAACAELGLTRVTRDTTIRAYDGAQRDADVAIHAGGTYAIGMQRKANGEYDLVSDWWGIRGFLAKHGQSFHTDEDLQNRLLQLSAKHAIVERYTRMGFRATTEEDEQGRIQLTLAR